MSNQIGTTPIPSELGTTITGAISNLYSSNIKQWIVLFNRNGTYTIDISLYSEFLLIYAGLNSSGVSIIDYGTNVFPAAELKGKSVTYTVHTTYFTNQAWYARAVFNIPASTVTLSSSDNTAMLYAR